VVSEPDSVPEHIGPYRVLRPVARGGMAAVFEVAEPGSERRLALKLLERQFRGQSRFGREYRALTRLDHPNIVRVYRYGVSDEGTPFLTMELLDGVAAQVHAKSCGRPGSPERTREAVRIIGEVARALSYLHARGVIHRDLKSSNVLVLRDGRVKVLDFGTARLAEAAEAIARNGEFVGTYAYAAPEQFSGGDVDARTDLYALGVLFYRLLTGYRPFDSDSPEELRQLHTEVTPRDPCSMVPGIPDEVGAVVMRLLNKSPDDRPESAVQVVDALVRHAVARPVRADLPEPSVVGRPVQIEAVRRRLANTKVGSPGVVMLAGPAGTGAARLLRQACTDARELGWSVVEDRMTGAAGLRGLAGIVRSVCRWGGVRSHPELGRVLTAVNRPGGAGTAADMARVESVLLEAIDAKGGPVLFALRDLGTAGPTVLRLLARIAATDRPLLVLGGASLERADTRSVLLEHFAQCGCDWLELAPLPADDVRKLVSTVLGLRNPPPRLVARLHAASGGRPGFLVDILRRMQRQGLASVDDGGPVDLSGGVVPMPESLAAVARTSLRDLPRGAADLLQCLAVADTAVSVELLPGMLGIGNVELDAALDVLQARHLVVGLADGAAWKVSYGLLAEVVRAGLRTARREAIVQRLALELVDSLPSPAVVRLQLEAGQVAEATRTAVQWAEHALEDGRADEAAPVLGRVVHAWRGVDSRRGCPGPLLTLQARAAIRIQPGSSRTGQVLSRLSDRQDASAAEIAFLQSRHLRWRPDPRAAAAQARAACALAMESDEVDVWVAAALSLAQDAVWAGRFDEARQEVAGVAARVRRLCVPELDIAVAIQSATIELRAGRPQAALDLLHPMTGARHLHTLKSRGEVGAVRAAAQSAMGQWSQALGATIWPLLSEIRLRGCPEVHVPLLMEAVQVRLALYQLGEVRDLLEESRGVGLHCGPDWHTGRMRLLGHLALLSGDPNTAIEELGRARDAARRDSLVLEACHAGGLLGRALLEDGRVDEGLATLDESALVAASIQPGPHAQNVTLCRLEGLASLRAPPSGVVRAAVAMVEGLVSGDSPIVRARACVALVRIHRDDPARQRRAVIRARAALDALESDLSIEERAALQIHPWRVEVERAYLARPS